MMAQYESNEQIELNAATRRIELIALRQKEARKAAKAYHKNRRKEARAKNALTPSEMKIIMIVLAAASVITYVLTHTMPSHLI